MSRGRNTCWSEPNRSRRCYCLGMCGRYSVAVSGAALVDVLDLDRTEPGFEWEPAYSVAPRTRAPVIRDRLIGEQRVSEAFMPTWGFRPSWAKEKGPRPINARLETAASNGMFQKLAGKSGGKSPAEKL